MSDQNPRTDTTDPTAAVAGRIADALLTNGFGDVAARLVLRAPDGRDLGGWSRAPIVQLVQRELENHGR